jgi:hypothetical protein
LIMMNSLLLNLTGKLASIFFDEPQKKTKSKTRKLVPIKKRKSY